jgi:hypothetical protein
VSLKRTAAELRLNRGDSRWATTGLVAGGLGILERYGVGTHGSGGPGQATVHGHPVLLWEQVVRVGVEVIVVTNATSVVGR